MSATATSSRLAGRAAPARPSLDGQRRDERERAARRRAPGARRTSGAPRTGCGVGIDAFASPIGAHAIAPPLRTTCGRTPKNAGIPEDEVGELADLDRADLARRCRARPPGRSCTSRRSGARARCRRPAAVPAPSGAFIACAVCQVRMIVSPTRPIACESEPIIEIAPRSWRTSSAAIVRRADAALGEREVLGDARVQVVADHEHVEVLGDRVDRVRARRVRRRRQHVRVRGDADDVRRVAAAGALGVVGVDRPAGDRLERRLEEAGLVERVGVDRDLDAGLVGDAQAGVDRGRRRAPVLVQLEAARAGAQLLAQRPRRETVLPLPSRSTLTGAVVERDEHRPPIARGPGVHGRRLRPLGRPGAAADQRRDAGARRASSTICGQIRWTWQSTPPAVRIRPSPARISVDGPISRAGCDAVGDVGVAGLAERDDPPVADADVALDDAPVVEHDDVRDHEVGRALGARRRALEHRLADRLAAAEDRLVAADAAVVLDLDPEVGVGEAHLVADGRAVERGVAVAVDRLTGAHLQARARGARRRARRASTSRATPGSKRTRRAGGDVEPEARRGVAVELRAPG